VCNSNLKSTFFPIAGVRCTAPGDLRSERPFLCYPLGDADDDPEDLVTFVATTAVPAAKSGHKRNRGQVIIDFFDLNECEQLHRERARMILVLGNALGAIAKGESDEEDKQLVERLLAPHFPHVSCSRAFKRLWDKDQPFARKVLKVCKAYVVSNSGTVPPAMSLKG
jgi:hypothetical protein